MKHLKMLGLLVMAAASLMAFASSASAATLTSPAGTTYTGPLKASLEGSALLKASFAEITCTTGEVGGNVTTNNETEASGTISKVSFSSCGNSTVTTLDNSGTLKILKSNHAVSGTGVKVTVSEFGVSCVYGLGTGTTLGTATNTATETVTLSIHAKLKKIEGGFLCASEAEWTAPYLVTEPHPSILD